MYSYEKRIQDVIEEKFNRPDYNSWHKYDRHTDNAYMKSKDGTVEVNTEEAIMFRAADKSAFNISIEGVHNQLEYEECCETLRSLLKPAVADMVIAIALDGYTVGEYAASIDEDANNVSHRLVVCFSHILQLEPIHFFVNCNKQHSAYPVQQ